MMSPTSREMVAGGGFVALTVVQLGPDTLPQLPPTYVYRGGKWLLSMLTSPQHFIGFNGLSVHDGVQHALIDFEDWPTMWESIKHMVMLADSANVEILWGTLPDFTLGDVSRTLERVEKKIDRIIKRRKQPH